MFAFLKKIADDSRFQNFVTGVIVLAGVVVGLETHPPLVERYGTFLSILNDLILWIFVVEVLIKVGAEGRKPWRYFLDPWNVFDFIIVAVCFMPVNAQYVAVLRLARLLRVLKLVRALPKLQVLVSALLKSIPSMGYVALLLGMLFYVYSVAAVFLFGGNDPVHFGNLAIAMLSLFRVVTGEDWTDVMYIQMWGCDKYGYDGMMELCTQPMSYPVFGALFFVSFMLLGAMVILNLFIGVIMGGMDEAEKENKLAALIARRESGTLTPSDDFAQVLVKLDEIHEELELLRAKRSVESK
ncbi:MAG: voltage-gated sodium channel [Myxococcota bacterium]